MGQNQPKKKKPSLEIKHWELCLMSFRVGGSPVEGTGPSALCSFGHRQHGELHLLPQVDQSRSLVPFCIFILCIWIWVDMCFYSACTLCLGVCMCCPSFKVAAAGFPEGVWPQWRTTLIRDPELWPSGAYFPTGRPSPLSGKAGTKMQHRWIQNSSWQNK